MDSSSETASLLPDREDQSPLVEDVERSGTELSARALVGQNRSSRTSQRRRNRTLLVCVQVAAAATASAAISAALLGWRWRPWPARVPTTAAAPKESADLTPTQDWDVPFFTQPDRDCKKRRVACVGASITEGKRGWTWSRGPYPDQLQEMLGDNFSVRNFGVGERTVLKTGTHPYWENGKFQDAKTWCESGPNIVVFQFGADDTKFPEEFKKRYHQDYASMIEAFRGLPAHPQIYIMTPPPAFKNGMAEKWKIDPQVVNYDLQPHLETIAADNHLDPPISVLQSFTAHCPDLDAHTCEWISSDGVHPNRRGFNQMAKLVSLVIQGEHCSVPLENKTACGKATIRDLDCEKLGCCYDDTQSPACFHKLVTEVPARPEDCAAKDEQKTNCGYPDISARACKSRGCCYEPSHVPGMPWCFRKFLTTTTTTVTTSTDTSTTNSTTTTSTTVSTTYTTTSTTSSTSTSTKTTVTTSTTSTTLTSTTTSTSTSSSSTSTTNLADKVRDTVGSVVHAFGR